MRKWIAACALAVCAATMAAGESRTVAITDHIGVDWRQELVHWGLQYPKGAMKEAAVRVSRAGEAVPCQVSDVKRYEDGSVRSLAVWVMADVPAYGSVSYQIEPGKPAQEGEGVSVQVEGDTVVMTTRVPEPIGIRLLGGARRYDKPVAASEVPGPLKGLLLPSGRWTGRGRFEVPFKVKSYESQVLAEGPLFGEVRVRYEFAEGYWVLKARVIKGCPMVVVEEELDTGDSGMKWDKFDGYYCFVLNGENFGPDRAFYTGHAYTQREPEYKDILSAEGHGRGVFGYHLSFREDREDYYLSSWPAWHRRVGTYIRFVEPGRDAIGFSTMNTAFWRHPMSLRFAVTASGELLVRFPIQIYEQHWLSDGYHIISPHYTGCTLGVSEHTSRRSFGIMLSRAEDEVERKLDSLQSLTSKLGSQPLDEVKDWVLDWPDPMKDAQWAEQPTDRGRKALQVMRDWIAYMQSRGDLGIWSLGNYHNTMSRCRAVKPVLDDPKALTWQERRRLRSLCAFQAYVAASPGYLPWGVGSHPGNPNMSAIGKTSQAMAIDLIPDHPLFRVWERRWHRRPLQGRAFQEMRSVHARLAHCSRPQVLQSPADSAVRKHLVSELPAGHRGATGRVLQEQGPTVRRTDSVGHEPDATPGKARAHCCGCRARTAQCALRRLRRHFPARLRHALRDLLALPVR